MRIKNYFRYIKAATLLVFHLQRQKWYIRRVIEPLLKKAESSNDGTLEANDFKKIRNYYALYVVAILGENYCTLRGKGLTRKERRILTFQGAMTGLYDDFFDHPNRLNKDVRAMMDDPFSYHAKDSVEQLFLHFLREIHLALPEANKEIFRELFDEIYAVQEKSKLQINSFLSETELRLITREKGGLSHVFYRIGMKHALSDEERDTLFLLGYILQQVNDLFDLWKDFSSGISTFATKSRDMRVTKLEFENNINLFYAKVHGLPYPKSRKQDFFIQFMIFFGMGIVCLNQYIALQDWDEEPFNPENYSREQLVCDMDLKSNRLKLKEVCENYDFMFQPEKLKH